MRKNLLIIFVILIIILVIACMKYKDIQATKREVAKFNYDYEEYNKDNLNGLDITTLINRAISNNEKFGVEKNEENLYNLEDENCIEIYIKMIINNTTYRMERINNLGIDSFIEYFGEVSFKCIDIKYHKNGRIKSMTFEAKEY